MSGQVLTPRDVALRGALAGAFGTAAMTAWQALASTLQSSGEEESQVGSQNPWEQAPAPAKVAKRIGEGIFQKDVSPDLIPLLSNAMHWAYGTSWGLPYGLSVAGRPGSALRRGATLGVAVWASSYLQLVPMGIYQPPWKYKPQELALDLSYHLIYGLGASIAFNAMER
jgi:hypothetical protein